MMRLLDAIYRSAALGRPVKIRHLPVPVLRFLPPLVRPFNEFAARLMSMGYWSATTDNPMPHWRVAADRFGMQSMTVEEWLRRDR